MESHNFSSMRLMMRPSSSAATTSSSAFSTTPLAPHISSSSVPAPATQSSSSSSSSLSSSQNRSPEGVVVVGFIGKREDDVTQLINRILDSNVFGSGNLDKSFQIQPNGPNQPGKEELGEEVKNWFQCRNISYYYEEEKGIVFLQFSSTRCPAIEGLLESRNSPDFDSLLGEHEFGDLQGLLVMFSVCHVIIFLQEGSHFDTQNLKRFRMLQAAKHALVPFVKSRIVPTMTSKVSSSSAQASLLATSKNSSPGRGGGNVSRHASAISLMSGLGSYTSLFPGQCTPVILFVFLDDFSDSLNCVSNVEESTDSSPLHQSSILSSLPRTSLPMKGSNSVVVLARPTSKTEGGVKKKLQSSLEGQVRFLIKKCRTLAGSDSIQSGSRSGGNPSSAPLFSLEASRAVALLERSMNQKGESLEFATSLVEEVLNAKAMPDTLLLESHNQSGNKEDIQSIKEFIYKQSDMLRGRGGFLTNANGGSAAGVGMVAVAAAAAAASAASGKSYTSTPELPSLENWLFSSQLILFEVLSARSGCLDESEISRKKPLKRNSTAAKIEGIALRGKDPLETAKSWLESAKGLNMKFSASWCERALPAAKGVYLQDMPACYPTSLHEAQLKKALRAFHSMVKGPAVDFFTKRLEDECISIWTSGRQLCDAVSLTGKPCMHQRHNVEVGDSLLEAEVKQHSSGFVFLHACACGRSRRLRDDPFDFEMANVIFNRFPCCNNLLPTLQLPKVADSGPIQPSAWSLIRIGGDRYYKPSKGLLQSGFCSTAKFLLKLMIPFEKQKKSNDSLVDGDQKGYLVSLTVDPKVEPIADMEIKKAGVSQWLTGEGRNGGVENLSKKPENTPLDDKKVSFGRGLPHFTMRKPFSEVVAGSVATDSGFPPLQQRRLPMAGSEKNLKQKGARDKSEEQAYANVDYQGSKNPEDVSSTHESSRVVGVSGYADGDSLLKIGSNVVPVDMKSGGKSKHNTYLKHVLVYVGFEHECSRGHRFLLNPEHLNELGSSYLSHIESCNQPSLENPDQKMPEPLHQNKNVGHESVHILSNGMVTAGSKKEQNQSSIVMSTVSKSVEKLGEGFQSVTLDDGGCAFSLLNRNLPIYMKCPYCRISKSKKDPLNVKFATTISQLQRIFLVTPPFPVVLATSPVVQFETSCLPPSVLDHGKKQQFSLGCRVILPPESFLTLRLPFVYGVQLDDRALHPLNPFEHQPELTAWIMRGTVLQVVSKGSSFHDGLHT